MNIINRSRLARIAAACFAAATALPASAQYSADLEIDGNRPYEKLVDPELGSGNAPAAEEIDALVELATDSSRPVNHRMKALKALRSAGPKAKGAAKKLAKDLLTVKEVKPSDELFSPELADPNRLVRYRAAVVMAVAAIGPDAADETLVALRQTLAATANEIIQNRRLLNGEYGYLALDSIEATIEAQTELCVACFQALGAMGEKARPAVPLLVRAVEIRNDFLTEFNFPNYTAQIELVKALGKIGDRRASKVLQQVALTSEADWLRDAARDAIQRIQPRVMPER